MYNIYSIYSSVNGCWRCLHFLADMNSGIVNLRVQSDFISFGYILCNGFAGLYGNYIFICGTSVQLYILAVLTYCPTNGVPGFPLLISSAVLIFCLFDNNYCCRDEIFHSAFDLYFLDDY